MATTKLPAGMSVEAKGNNVYRIWNGRKLFAAVKMTQRGLEVIFGNLNTLTREIIAAWLPKAV